nr:MAG TPA: hypothetical protein [Caudoviricetes sp.]
MKPIYDIFATSIIKGETRYKDILPIFKKGVKKSLKEKGHPELADDNAPLATPSNATHEE